MNWLVNFGAGKTQQRSELQEAMFSVYLRELSVPIIQVVACGLILGIGGLGEVAQLVYPEELMGAAISWRLYVCLILGLVVVPVSVFDRAKRWINVLFGVAYVLVSLVSGYYLSLLREPHAGATFLIYLFPLWSIAMPARLLPRTLVTSFTLLLLPGMYLALGWEPALLGFVAIILVSMIALSVVLGHRVFYRLNRRNFFDGRDLKRKRQQVEYLAIHDQLTGLYNRGEFESRLEEEFYRSERYDNPLSLLMIDLDHFKKINDTHGHAAGDDVLRTIGTILNRAASDSVRRSDVPGRYGGEEFCLLLPETRPDGARKVAERIRERLKEEEFRTGDETFRVTCSIGISDRRPELESPESLVNEADEALYEAKDGGRDRVVLHES